MTCPHSEKPCVNRHDCERCKVPEAYGYFIEWHKGKSSWQQRFILDADRKAILHYYDMQIREAEKGKAELMKIPTKAEYLATLK